MSIVSHLRARPGTYAEGLDAFVRGDTSSCIALLAESRAPNAIMLRARGLIRAGRIQDAIDSLFALLEEEKSLTLEHAAQAHVLRANALFFARRPQEARIRAKEALERCRHLNRSDLECELLFGFAVSAAYFEDPNDHKSYIDQALAIYRDGQPVVADSDYPFTLRFWLSRLYEISSLTYHMVGNYRKKFESLQLAIQFFDQCGCRDDHLESILLANYADCGATEDSQRITDFVSSRVAKFDRNPDLSNALCRLYCNLAEAASLQGLQSEALRLFRSALEFVSEGPFRLRLILGRARLLQDCGELLAAREAIEQAVSYNKTINWASVDSIHAQQLLKLASLASLIDVQEAHNIFKSYSLLEKTLMIRGLSATHDPLVIAEEHVTRALIARASRRFNDAIASYREALSIFESLNYQEKAANVALDLSELTQGDSYLRIAQSWLALRPNSPLARRILRHVSDIATYDDALRAYQQSDFVLCVKLLNSFMAPFLVILRSRALIRLGQSDDAIKELETILTLGLPNMQRGEAKVLRAAALANSKSKAAFEAAFDDAFIHLQEYPSPNLSAELDFASACFGMLQGDYDKAIEAARGNKYSSVDASSHLSSVGFSSTYWQACCYEIVAISKDRAGRLHEALADRTQALRLFDNAQVRDSLFEVQVLSRIAELATSLGETSLAESAADRLARIEWKKPGEEVKIGV